MTDQNQRKIISVAHEVRTWGAVAIVGAGASLQSGFPLVAQLQSLVWHAVDADEEARSALAATHGWSGTTAREMIEDDPLRMRIALDAIAGSRAAHGAYQRGFARLNNERVGQPSPAHAALAELLHRRAVETVISFNWDTLLEVTYRRLYGRELSADGVWLHKPHGDAAHPEADWVLPHEAGVVPDEVARQMQEMTAERPRVLLIVGYSEGDEEIVNKLITPLAGRWRVVRVGPTARGESDIPMVAEQALPALARAIHSTPEVPGWEYVNFDGQHDLGSALAGERLGPKDVLTCPRLSEVDAVAQRLAVTNGAVITGASGSGKSITAYQAAYDLHLGGWEVLRLVDQRRTPDELLMAVGGLPWQTVLIVDDAQAMGDRLTRRLLEGAFVDLKVIVVTTDEVPAAGGAVRVAGERAVSVIADALRTTRRDESLQVVSRLDRRVGEGYMDASIEGRIEQAAREKTPWQFSYVLTGGEWRSREGIASLRDAERADLLLAAVAAGQLTSSDRGTSYEWLERAAHSLGRDREWLESSLRILRERRFVIGDGPYRCTHQRFAAVALESIYGLWGEPAWDDLTRMLRAALSYDNPSLGGIYSLLYAARKGKHFTGTRETVIDDDIWHRLTERCWAAPRGNERGYASGVIRELLNWNPRTLEAIRSRTTLLGEWLQTIDANSASGFAWLLNDISQEKARDVVEDICERADPTAVAASLASARWEDAYSWGELLRVLWMSREGWKKRLLAAIDVLVLKRLLAAIPPSQLFHLEHLIEGVYALDKNLAFDLTEEVLPNLADAVNANPAAVFHDIHDVTWLVFGCPPVAFMRMPVSRKQRELASRFALSLDPVAIGRAISTSRRRDWRKHAELLLFLRQTVKTQADAVVAAVDFESLDRVTQGMWAGPAHELVQLIDMLDTDRGEGPNPVRTWVERHATEYGALDITLARLVPREAVARLCTGQSLNLEFERGSWISALFALASIERAAEAVALGVLESNQDSLSKALVNIQKWECKEVELFIRVLGEPEARVLTAALAVADSDKAKANWATLLRGGAAEKNAAAAILKAAASVQGPIAEVVEELKQRFPKAAATKVKV